MFQEQEVCQKVSGVNPRSERRKVLGTIKLSEMLHELFLFETRLCRVSHAGSQTKAELWEK